MLQLQGGHVCFCLCRQVQKQSFKLEEVVVVMEIEEINGDHKFCLSHGGTVQMTGWR